MLDAARVDGANEYRMFWSIVLPNVRPALATMFILFALEYWNNLLWPLIVFRNPTNMPLAVGLASMVNQYKVSYDLLLAGTALATLPVILLFLVLRRQFMEGTASLGTGAQ
jgi:ABC-type glycerol-3-phosphate transport system permease component